MHAARPVSLFRLEFAPLRELLLVTFELDAVT
jgi:hypothetical protein